MVNYYDTIEFLLIATITCSLFIPVVRNVVFELIASIVGTIVGFVLIFLRDYVFPLFGAVLRGILRFAGGYVKFLSGTAVSSGEYTGKFLRIVLGFLGNRRSDGDGSSGGGRTDRRSAPGEEAVFTAVMGLAGYAAAAAAYDLDSRIGAEAAAREIVLALNGKNPAEYINAFGASFNPGYNPDADFNVVAGAVRGEEARAAVIFCLAYTVAAVTGATPAQRRRVAEIARRLGLGEARINAVFAEFGSGRDERYERRGRYERGGRDERYERNGRDERGGWDERYERNGRDERGGGRYERNGGGSGDGFDEYAEALKFFGLSEGAGEAEIRRVYLDMIKRYHPDRAGRPGAPDMSREEMEEMTRKINAAYDVLSGKRSG